MLGIRARASLFRCGNVSNVVLGWVLSGGVTVSGDKKRYQVTLSRRLAKDIDDFCAYTGLTRSDFLSMAAAVYLGTDPTVALRADEKEVMSWRADKATS